jgi:hypothetical protein
MREFAMGKSATPRLGDLERLGLTLEAVCSCGHRRVIRPTFLLKFQPGTTVLYPFVLERLAQQFRCSACHKHETTLTIGRFADDDAPGWAKNAGAAHDYGAEVPFDEAVRRDLERRADWRARGEQVHDGNPRRRRR